MDYFIPGPHEKAHMVESAKTIQELHSKYGDVFFTLGTLEAHFPCRSKRNVKQYEALPRFMAYTLQEPFKIEQKRLQEQRIIEPLGINKMAKWCKSFVIVPKPNGTAQLCLDLTWPHQTIIWLVHRGWSVGVVG